MSTSILPSFWTPAGLLAAQAQLGARADGVNTSVQACAALPPATKSSWNAFYSTLKQFTSTQFGWLTTTNPDGTWAWGGGTGETADRIQSYQSELFSWQQTLAKSCTLSVPQTNLNAPNPTTDAIETMVKYTAVAGTAFAAAYIVSKIAGAVSVGHAASAYREDIRDRGRARRRLRV